MFLVLWTGAAADAQQATQDDVFDSWARWVTHQARWRGQTVRRPDPRPRPRPPGLRLDSLLMPVHLHVPSWVDAERAQRALAAAEQALRYLEAHGFPVPPADGMRGGTPGLDVYLGPATGQPLAGMDGSNPLSLQDGAIVFAEVDALSPDLDSCVIASVGEAALLAADPAEAPTWRQATAAWIAWYLTGIAGCTPAVARGDNWPEEGFGHADAGPRGFRFLHWLNGRVGHDDGRFLGELWHFARQDSRGTRHLRGSPDLWEALERALLNAGQPLEPLFLEAANNRATRLARPGHSGSDRARPAGRQPIPAPLRADVGWTSLPRHLYPLPGVGPLGSSYTRVRVEKPKPQAQLRVWLRGELGPRWSLSAIQLDAQGREVGRLSAPPRKTPRSYLPVLLSGDTREVILVVTRLPDGLPDADLPAQAAAYYKLILDRAPP